MEKSSSSESSSHRWRNRDKGRVAGVPNKCWCGAGIIEKISGSEDNPYRRYYRCSMASSQKLRNDAHVFKWVDEAFYNEISQLEYQVSVLEEEVLLMKGAGNQTVPTADSVSVEALNEFEMSLLRNVDDVMEQALWKMKKTVALVFGACVMVVGVVVFLK